MKEQLATPGLGWHWLRTRAITGRLLWFLKLFRLRRLMGCERWVPKSGLSRKSRILALSAAVMLAVTLMRAPMAGPTLLDYVRKAGKAFQELRQGR